MSRGCTRYAFAQTSQPIHRSAGSRSTTVGWVFTQSPAGVQSSSSKRFPSEQCYSQLSSLQRLMPHSLQTLFDTRSTAPYASVAVQVMRLRSFNSCARPSQRPEFKVAAFVWARILMTTQLHPGEQHYLLLQGRTWFRSQCRSLPPLCGLSQEGTTTYASAIISTHRTALW